MSGISTTSKQLSIENSFYHDLSPSFFCKRFITKLLLVGNLHRADGAKREY